MNFFKNLFFRQNNKKSIFLKLPIIKKLKAVSQANKIYIFENITIYNNDKELNVPLLIIDDTNGIYLFEYKSWSFKELEKAQISQSTNEVADKENLSYKNTHKFIKEKFNDLIHNDGVDIYNFLIFDKLSNNEYNKLDDSFKNLLPENRIIFSNTSTEDMLKKLKSTIQNEQIKQDQANIAANLLFQYLVKDKDNSTHIASREQIDFIDSQINNTYQILDAVPYSGKTTFILLKSILEKIKNPDLKIILIAPNTLASDILKQKLLSIVEYSIINIDISSILILTPTELVNRHLTTLHLPQLDEELDIPDKILNEKFNIADLIICDDSDLLPNIFIAYLIKIQKKKALLLVSNKTLFDKKQTIRHTFSTNFRKTKQKVIFEKENQHAKALQIISHLLHTQPAKDILVISSNLSREKLNDDLNFFIRDKAILLDSSKQIIDQNLDNLILSTYEQLGCLRSKFVILLDIDQTPIIKLQYAINLSDDSVYILYEDNCEQIETMKAEYEDNKE